MASKSSYFIRWVFMDLEHFRDARVHKGFLQLGLPVELVAGPLYHRATEMCRLWARRRLLRQTSSPYWKDPKQEETTFPSGEPLDAIRCIVLLF